MDESITDDDEEYIPPDYSEEETEFDKDCEDEDDIEFYGSPSEDEDEAAEEEKVEEIVNKQDDFNNKKQEEKYHMNSTPFNQPMWDGQQSTPWPGTQFVGTSMPWQQQRANPQPGFQSWQDYGGGYDYGGYDMNQTIIQVPKDSVRIERPKKAVIIDIFDGLIESVTSNGKPNIPPRGLYDIKFKLNVWDAIATFSPVCVCGMYPIIAGWNRHWDIAMQYMMISLAEYLKLPEQKCIFAKQSSIELQKPDILERAYRLVPFGRNEVVYIGIYSGFWGLGNGDLAAAQQCKIPYADIIQVVKGEV
jgi:hypothetical protein